jgi:hypothetical protein
MKAVGEIMATHMYLLFNRVQRFIIRATESLLKPGHVTKGLRAGGVYNLFRDFDKYFNVRIELPFHKLDRNLIFALFHIFDNF